MLRIPFILAILAAGLLLVACPPVNPPTCEELGNCPPPLPCEDEPDGCQEPKITFTSSISQNPKPVFNGGDTLNGSFTIKTDDPDETIGSTVIFLNLVTACQPDQPCNPQQAGGDLFASEDDVTITNNIFQKVLTGDELRVADGLTTSFSGKLKSSAKPGEYSMFIQIFECTNTDPNSVGTDSNCFPRLAGKGYRFFVE